MTRVLSIHKTLLALVALNLSINAFAGFLVEPDPEWREAEHTLPAPPQNQNLKAFSTSPPSLNQLLIDLNSISIGTDQVIRYTLVIRTPGGAENITFEGIRCNTMERQLYANGRKNGTWVPVKKPRWQPLSASAYHRPAVALASTYFCDGTVPALSREEILRLFENKSGYFEIMKGRLP